MVVNKKIKLLAEVQVYNLSLAISLRVKYSKKLNFNPKNIVNFILEIWYKLGFIVKDNWFKSAVDPVNIINIYIDYIFFYSYSLKVKKGDSLFI